MALRLHREGTRFLMASGTLLGLLIAVSWLLVPAGIAIFLTIGLAGLFLFVLQFFRHPERPIPQLDEGLCYAPADGTIVTIETTQETEFFQDERIQLSIFMSPLNVHVNRSPISGTIAYFKYHAGKYLMASHPKSSDENERTTIVIAGSQQTILLRQVAGAMARRIRTYLDKGDTTQQGDELGFIKFGSRVDVFLPLHAEIKVKVGQRVKSNNTVLAGW